MAEAAVQEKIDEGLLVEVPDEKDEEVDVGEDKPIDPGSLEGLPKSKKEVFIDDNGDPGPDHGRYKKIWAQLKDSKREIELLKTGGKTEDKHLLKEMQLHNKRLQEAFDRQTEVMEESNKTAQEKVGADALADNRIAQKEVEKDLQEAYEQRDALTIENLNNKLLDLKMGERDLKNPTKVETPTPAQPAQITIPPEQQKLIDEWAQNVDWYQKDAMKTGAAISAERQVLTDPEWQGKPYPDQLKEVQRRVEAAFGVVEKKLEVPEPDEKVSGISGVESSGGNRGGGQQKRTVKVSAAEVRVAKGFGMTIEEYARQKEMI